MTPFMKTVFLGAALILAAAGCPSTIVVNGITVVEETWREAEPAVTARAKADLHCEDVTLKLLAVHPAGSPQEIEATGCDQSSTYVPGPDGWAQRP